MSTSLLYHACSLRGYHYLRTEYVGNDIIFWIQPDRRKWCCAACGSLEVIGRGHGDERTFKNVPFGLKGTLLKLAVQLVECKSCGVTRQLEIGFAEERRTFTNAFERYALELSRKTTILDTARHLKVGWDTVKGIQMRYLSRRYAKPRLRDLRYLGIDEICVGHGYRYLTVVLDMGKGAVVFVGDGKGADALTPFWKRLKASKARVKAVAMDMSAAYIDAVSRNLPSAKIVFDRFHITKLFNEKLSQLRRQLQNEASAQDKSVLKGTRWLLLKNPENLEDSRHERERLEQALLLNQPLATAYYLKEDLRELWAQRDRRQAKRYFEGWLKRARASDIGLLKKLADTLEAHRDGILAWYDHGISNGPLEGTNNKIKTMQRQAYGFRDMEYFKLRILAIHETRYALIG
ncbi:MAG: ISL3 family transposase [Candidatus Xenobia bacterium]